MSVYMGSSILIGNTYVHVPLRIVAAIALKLTTLCVDKIENLMYSTFIIEFNKIRIVDSEYIYVYWYIL